MLCLSFHLLVLSRETKFLAGTSDWPNLGLILHRAGVGISAHFIPRGHWDLASYQDLMDGGEMKNILLKLLSFALFNTLLYFILLLFVLPTFKYLEYSREYSRDLSLDPFSFLSILISWAVSRITLHIFIFCWLTNLYLDPGPLGWPPNHKFPIAHFHLHVWQA